MQLIDEKIRAHHTAICVTDFERARNFYCGFLGFELEGEMDRRSEPALGEVVGLPGAVVRWAMLRHDSYRVELFKYYSPEGDPRPRRQCDFGFSHMAFEVTDVESVYRQVVDAGYRTVSSPQVLRNGRTKVFYVEEPEGAITEFIQFLQATA